MTLQELRARVEGMHSGPMESGSDCKSFQSVPCDCPPEIKRLRAAVLVALDYERPAGYCSTGEWEAALHEGVDLGIEKVQDAMQKALNDD